MLRQHRDILALEENAAGIGEERATDRAEERRFARAVRADDRDEITVCHGERQIVEGGLGVLGAGVERFGDVLQFQHLSEPPFASGRGGAAAGAAP